MCEDLKPIIAREKSSKHSTILREYPNERKEGSTAGDRMSGRFLGDNAKAVPSRGGAQIGLGPQDCLSHCLDNLSITAL